MKLLRKLLFIFLIVLLIGFGIFFWPFNVIKIEGDGMGKNFSNSYHITFRLTFGLKRNDVILYKLPGWKTGIARIVGLPGEKIELIDGKVYIDDSVWMDGYDISSIKQGTLKKGRQTLWVLQKNQFFLLGDNRIVSMDSREIGPVSINEINGRIVW